jgi:8-oxo-dGTP diphosphatase
VDRPLKVVAYIIRDERLLVFVHADHDSPLQAGLQVPAGTVRPGEFPQTAVLREAFEETDLRGLRVERFLGVAEYDARPYRSEIHVRHFFQLSVDALNVPERWTAYERGDGDIEPIRFELFWIPLKQAHVVSAGQAALLGRAFDN